MGDTQMEIEEEGHNIEKALACLHLPPQELAIRDTESEEDDEEDGEKEEDRMILGFVQKPENPYSLARHFFPSKAGGTPAWLDPINIPTVMDSCCGICGNPLQFLIQVYAPIEEKDDAFHRTLSVFMCPSMACLQQDQIEQRKLPMEKASRSVKVFRCQLARENPFYPVDPPKHDGHDAPLSSGVALCSWCGTWRGGKICSGCKMARYCSRQHQVDHWRAGHAADCRQILSMSTSVVAVNGLTGNCNSSQVVSADGSQNDYLVKAASTHLWPELEIIDEEEGNMDSEGLDEQVPENAIATNQQKDEEFLRQFTGMEASRDQKHWASFQARISRYPDQVLRYCRSKNAKILWPRLEGQPRITDIPKCTLCEGPRYFEFQILPQLLYFFKVQNDSDSLDWGTIVIYACPTSCRMNSLGYVEEFAWVQLAS